MKKVLKNKNKLRIAHYNILHGGKGRLKYIKTVLGKINPDVCGILEAVGDSNEIKKIENIAKSLGYKFELISANSKYNIAIFSKVQISICVIKKNIKHVVASVKILEGYFKNLEIFFVHLSPVSENERLLEVGELKKHIKKNSPIIIMGDLNSLSSRDLYNQEKLLNFFKENKITKYGTNRIYFKVISEIEKLGFKDAMIYLKKSFSYSTPTRSNKDINHKAKIRIDYAFLSRKMLPHIKKSVIVKNKLTDISSDHYPFYIDLK